MNRKQIKRRWLLQGGLGSSLTGFGLCCMIESGFLKHGNEAHWLWIGVGTISLIITLAGINLLIGAVKWRLKLDEYEGKGE